MKTGFCLFLEFGTIDGLDIVYYDSINVFQHLTTLPDYEGSFKCHKYAFLNDPKRQKRGFWPFLSSLAGSICQIRQIV